MFKSDHAFVIRPSPVRTSVHHAVPYFIVPECVNRLASPLAVSLSLRKHRSCDVIVGMSTRARVFLPSIVTVVFGLHKSRWSLKIVRIKMSTLSTVTVVSPNLLRRPSCYRATSKITWLGGQFFAPSSLSYYRRENSSTYRFRLLCEHALSVFAVALHNIVSCGPLCAVPFPLDLSWWPPNNR